GCRGCRSASRATSIASPAAAASSSPTATRSPPPTDACHGPGQAPLAWPPPCPCSFGQLAARGVGKPRALRRSERSYQDEQEERRQEGPQAQAGAEEDRPGEADRDPRRRASPLL